MFGFPPSIRTYVLLIDHTMFILYIVSRSLFAFGKISIWKRSSADAVPAIVIVVATG